MDNNEKQTDKSAKKENMFEIMRRLDAEDRKAALAEEAKEAAEKAEAEEKQRRSYEEKLRQEKLELMKLKQGVISETDIEKEEKVEKNYTVWEKISNFVYHNKAYLIVGAMFVFIAVFLVADFIKTERPDLKALFIANDYDMSVYAGELTDDWSGYSEDYNGDKKLIAKLYYVPAYYTDNNSATAYLAQSDRTKLLGEFQSGETIIIIGDKHAYTDLGIMENVFYDARELFPDDEYAEELGYRLAGTDLKELMGYSDMDDSQLYVSFRKPVKTMGDSEEKMQMYFDRSVEFWKKFISEHRIDGLSLEPTEEYAAEPSPYDYENYTEDTRSTADE
ncbi:MAG: hypothetical protein ACI4Q6_07760 [Huintestinicola sp.]